jgi:hypothetical protein
MFIQKVYLQLSMTSPQSPAPTRPDRYRRLLPQFNLLGFQLIELLLQRLNFLLDGIREYGRCAPREHDQSRSNPIFHTRLADHRSFFSPSPVVRKNATPVLRFHLDLIKL